MPPDPPSISMLCMLIVLHTIYTIVINQDPPLAKFWIRPWFACTSKWIISQKKTKISISPVAFTSLLRNLASVTCINILKHTKILKILGFSLDATCTYISTINTMLCNTDTKVFSYITQKDDRR